MKTRLPIYKEIQSGADYFTTNFQMSAKVIVLNGDGSV